MRMNYTLIIAALLLFTLVGCTDESNPAGPGTALQLTTDAKDVVNTMSRTVRSSDSQGSSDAVVLVARGRFVYTENANDERTSADALTPTGNMVRFSVGLSLKQAGRGNLEFMDEDGPDFDVAVQEVSMNDDGSVSFNGSITSSESVGAPWFFAHISDRGNTTGDSFAYYLGEADDEPNDEDFTALNILSGDIIIYQNAF